MTDKPIIFSAPMVRALLAGRKTQTRRVMKPQPSGIARAERIAPKSWRIFPEADRCTIEFKAPPYATGDRLYVREAHALVPATAYRMSDGVVQAVDPQDSDRACIYREGFDRSTGGIRWRPSIHMPRWASRITLTVTEVRVQRLQEISEADAVAEGVESGETPRGLMWKAYGDDPNCWVDTARISFIRLWNSLHGPDAWDANPWVVAVSFTVEQRNIDAAREVQE